jgi:electron transfer flavoprotein beta subunit
MPLNLVVCMKQIPNPDLQFAVRPDAKDIKRETLNYKTNGSDDYALEAAVQLKEAHGGRVVVVTVGPKRTESMLREALAKGADEAVRIADDEPTGFDSGKVARILAAALKTIPHDLILTGVQSDDLVNGSTGALIAGLLGLPHASVVTKLTVGNADVEVDTELEGGLVRRYELPLPALVSIQFGANTPRYAPLPAIMKAARQPIRELGPAALGFASWNSVPTPYTFSVRGVAPPGAKGHATMIVGDLENQAKQLAKLLRDRGFSRG